MVLAKLQAKAKEIDEKVKAWVAAQPAHMEVLLVTAGSSLQGGVIGMLMGSLTSDMAASIPTPPGAAGGAMSPEATSAMKQMQALSGGPLVQARNFAVMTGVNAGITCALRRQRGIAADDVQSSMVAAFGSGVAFSLVSGVGGGPNPVANILSTGVAFALFQGAFFQIGKMLSGGAAGKASEASEYVHGSSMLRSLGLQKYERNFKRGLLTDRTLRLLNDSALQEVKIPPGPRLLILDHIRRSPDDCALPRDSGMV